MRLVSVVALGGLLLASCSDPKAVNKSNFKRAINDYIEKNPPCIDLPSAGVVQAEGSQTDFPRYVQSTPDKDVTGEQIRQKQLLSMSALVDAGLLKSTNTTINETPMMEMPSKNIPVIAYSLTNTGSKALYQGPGQNTLFHTPSFCYGKPKVDEVAEFTEPADMMGIKLSQVSYRYHLTDLPSWTSNAKVQAAFPDLSGNLAAHLDGKAAVILTNDGWKHEKAVKM